MTTWIALLRAVNIVRHQRVAMADLRDVLSQLGLADPRSLLQSGNLVFRAAARQAEVLEQALETEVGARLSLHTDFVLRSAAEWRGIVDANPFPEVAKRDPAHLAVMFLKRAPSASDVEALRSAAAGPEVFQANGKHLYAVYPNGFGRSRLTLALIERKLRTRGTGRNWNTVLKLKALAED